MVFFTTTRHEPFRKPLFQQTNWKPCSTSHQFATFMTARIPRRSLCSSQNGSLLPAIVFCHLTFRRTFSIKERIAFELDHYDRHLVPQETAEKHPWVWRVNLLGGGRLQDLAARMDAMPKLRKFVETQKWDYGEGFIAATTGKREPAPWLTGKPFLPTEALTDSRN